MRVGTRLYLLLLAAVGAVRLAELGFSRGHQRRLVARGASILPEPGFRWMVLVHSGVLAASAVEVVALKRRPPRALAAAMALAFALANALRWWVIHAMGEHWNVRVVDSVELGVVSTGPFRWVRHPNYLALIVELEALPLMHGAWLSALLGGLAHCWVLWRRIRIEEAVLERSAGYRSLMGSKPRFVPRVWPR
ncbi:MAG TPA: isoprenylcysteine carboxylmethyltransferase family protein [Dehalococcoidia bacterium]|nr:isoprenylcysteine carboxylmethyltransferase family protein [Dehalococcoidia bacterium]